MILRCWRGRWPLLVLLPLLLPGCSLKQKSPDRFTYQIEAVRPGEAPRGAGRGALRLRSLSVAPSYEERGFVYRTSDRGYETDFYREFLVTPRAMLTEQVRQWLDASGLFRAVLDPASKAEAAYSMEGHVSALYADLRDKAAPKAILSIEFSLLHHQSGVPEVVVRRRYHQETRAADRSPESLALSWSKGLAQILAAWEAELARTERPLVP